MSDVIQPPLPIKTEDELKKQQIEEFVDDDNFKAFFTIDLNLLSALSVTEQVLIT